MHEAFESPDPWIRRDPNGFGSTDETLRTWCVWDVSAFIVLVVKCRTVVKVLQHESQTMINAPPLENTICIVNMFELQS